MSRWDDRDDWEHKSDREVLEHIELQLRSSGLARDDHDVLPLGGVRGRLGNSLEGVKDRFGWIVRELGQRLRKDRATDWKHVKADCYALGLIIEEPSAVALKWLFERLETELAIDMAKHLRRAKARAEIKVEFLKERTKADRGHFGARCGEMERYYRYVLWVTDPEEDAEPVEVWHWHRSIAAGEYNYRENDPEWATEVEPGWWNWENTPPTDMSWDFRSKDQQLCKTLEVSTSWPPGLIYRSDVPKVEVPEGGDNGGPYR